MGDRTLDKESSSKVNQEVDVISIAAGDNNIGNVDIASALPVGSNKIGKVVIRNAADGADIDPLAESTFTGRVPTNGQKAMSGSLPVVLSSDQSAVPIKTNAGDEVVVVNTVIDPVDGSGASVQIKFAEINATSDGDNTIVAANASKKIRVIAYSLSVGLTGTIIVKRASTAVARLNLTAGTAASFAGALLTPAFETAVNEALIINNPAGVDTFGHLTYIEI